MSAAAAASDGRCDECTGEPACPSAPKDLNIGRAAPIGCDASLEDGAAIGTVGRGATGAVTATGGVSCGGVTAIGAAIGTVGRGATGAFTAAGGVSGVGGVGSTAIGAAIGTEDRGATGAVTAAGGVSGVGGVGSTAIGTAIGRDGRAQRCSKPLSTSRGAPFSNRSSVRENSPSDANGGASTASTPRAIA
ncbi:MAG TPA: hypothetical protein VNC21_03475 [Vicinamibacterales bacterium]|nr:hypothetical protein [Vicinamibacterales bacterium]